MILDLTLVVGFLSGEGGWAISRQENSGSTFEV